MRAAIPLLLFMAGIQGWVLSLPLFGPLLFPLAEQAGVDPFQTATLFLNCYSLSFIIWGVLLHKLNHDWKRLLTLLNISVFMCLLLNFSLFWVDSRQWNFVFAAIGLFVSLPSLSWLYLLKRMISGHRLGFAFGINGILVSGFHLGFQAFQASQVSAIPGLHLASGLIVLALLMLPYIKRLAVFTPHSQENSREHQSNPLPLLLFIFIIFLLGGIMYQVINPLLTKFPMITDYYMKAAYLLTMPIVGWLIDRQGFRTVVYGMASLGLAYTLFAFSSSFSTVFIGSSLIQIGFAFLDVFVLYALSTWNGNKRPFLFLGIGLGVYILSIRVGLILNVVIVPISQENYKITCLLALGILLVSFLLVHWLGDAEPQAIEKKLLFNKLTEYFKEKDAELKLAAKIQQQMLPNQQQLPNGMDTASYLLPSREVGGDFFDVILLDSKRVLLVIGDVTDKGLPAALIMSKVIGLIRSEAYHKHTLPEIIKQLNLVLFDDGNSSFMLVTLGLALVDTESGTLTYASAGHVSPYIIKQDQVKQIASSSFPIGVDSEINPFVVPFPIEKQDILVLFTDGVVEAQNSKQELYGFGRLESKLQAAASLRLSPNEIKSLILSDVKLFAETDTYKDDVTFLIVKLGE